MKVKPLVSSWKQFAYRVRARQERLLVRLDRFPDAVLVTGCQRSGGTMLSRLLTGSRGMTRFWFSRDEELDAAQILAGTVDYHGTGRHCFQTTYLNERWAEYLDIPASVRVVWTLRNPHSVVTSMVYNWKRFALDELFLACGLPHMSPADRIAFQRWGKWGVPPLRRAAYAYVGKVSQLVPLAARLPADRLTVLEYDTLVRERGRWLPALFERLAIAYDPAQAAAVSERSLGKRERLTAAQSMEIERICQGAYQQGLLLVNLHPAAGGGDPQVG